MLVAGFPAAAFGTNCYVVATGPGQECVVVDPGIEVVAQLDALLAEHDVKPVAVLLTHGHLDHTFSVTPVCGARGIPAWIHADDEYLLADPMKGLSAEARQIFGGRLEWSRARRRAHHDRRRRDEPRRPGDHRRPRARPHPRLGDVPAPRRRGAGSRARGRQPGLPLRRRALPGLDRPDRPARRRRRADDGEPAHQGAHRCPTTCWCCPVTAAPPRSGRERAANPFLADAGRQPPTRGRGL